MVEVIMRKRRPILKLNLKEGQPKPTLKRSKDKNMALAPSLTANDDALRDQIDPPVDLIAEAVRALAIEDEDARQGAISAAREAMTEEQRSRFERRLRKRAEGWLRSEYPGVFNPKAPVPLQLGVGAELRKVMPKKVSTARGLKTALARWVRRDAYQAALAAPGAQRWGLDGLPVGPVSEEHQRWAREGKDEDM